MTRAVVASIAAASLLAACGDTTTEVSDGRGRVVLEVVATGSGRVLDSGRVHLEGPTPQELSATPGTTVTIEQLNPGSYTLTLEGFVGNEVERFGRTTGVEVRAGQTTAPTVAFNLFQPVFDPVTLSDDAANLRVAFPAVPGADSYRVEVDTTTAFATASAQVLTGTSADFAVLRFGPHFIRARAFDVYEESGVLTPAKTATVHRLLAFPDQDGWVENDGGAFNLGAVTFVGDNGVGVVARSFFSFDLSTIAAAEEVHGAVMRIFQIAIQGDPYGGLGGGITVDHLDYSPALDDTDYGLAPFTADIGTISSVSDTAYKSLPVTTQVQADRTAGRSASQFRIRFPVEDDADGAADFVVIYTAEKVDTVPELVVVSE